MRSFERAVKGPLQIAPEMPAKTPLKSSFGKRRFAPRTARGLTQVDLAKAMGTTQRVISYYETKGELPTPDFLVALVRVLGTTADELLGIKPPKLGPDNRPEQRRLWKRFQRMESLPGKIQRVLIRLINSLVGSAKWHGSFYAPFFLIQQGNSGSRKKKLPLYRSRISLESSD
jgi:transcriptional regulator with XRE-family HTH domain